MKKAFITGITGFAGSFLAEYLLAQGDYEVSGTYLSDKSIANVDPFKDKLKLFKVDLQNLEDTQKAVSDSNPDEVYHLAALSSAGASFNNPAEFINNNISAQVNLFEAIRNANILPRTLIVSSAEVYGYVDPSNLPINENAPLRPINPSKP